VISGSLNFSNTYWVHSYSLLFVLFSSSELELSLVFFFHGKSSSGSEDRSGLLLNSFAPIFTSFYPKALIDEAVSPNKVSSHIEASTYISPSQFLGTINKIKTLIRAVTNTLSNSRNSGDLSIWTSSHQVELIIKCEQNSVNLPTHREMAPLLPGNGHLQHSRNHWIRTRWSMVRSQPTWWSNCSHMFPSIVGIHYDFSIFHYFGSE
jgi:hypothetical protein